MQSHTRQGQGSSATVTRTRKGWLVEIDSQWTGSMTGQRILVYPTTDLAHNRDLDSAWNTHMSFGDSVWFDIPFAYDPYWDNKKRVSQ